MKEGWIKTIVYVIFLAIVLVLFLCASVLAADFTPQGDINLREVYDIKNAVDINGTGNFTTSGFFVGDGTFIENITVNETTLNHSLLSGLQGGNTSEYYHVNASQYTYLVANLFSWISTWLIPDQTSDYIYNDSDTIYFNDTRLDQDIEDANTSMKNYADGTFITLANESNLNVNSSDYWDDFNTSSDLNYLILSKWENITDRPTFLSNFTDDLGDRGYTSLSNFTDDLGNRGYTDNLNFTNGAGYWNDTYATFNKTYGDTLYAGIEWDYNQTIPAINYSDETFIRLDNESNLSVNRSDYWDNYNDTNLTWFENVLGTLNLKLSQLTIWTNEWFATQTTDNLTEGSVNLYDNQSWNETRGDDIYVNIDGDTWEGPMNASGYNLSDVGNLSVTEEMIVGGQINTTGDVIIGERLFVGADPSESESVVNSGDVGIGGNVILASGAIAVFPKQYGPSALFFNNGDDDAGTTIFYLNFSGVLNTSTEEFCDYLNDPFNDSNLRDVVNVIYSTEFGFSNIYLPINNVVNSSCVEVETRIFGTDNVTELTNVSYAISPQPVFGILDNDLVLNGITMTYETNESSDFFGAYTWENTLQDKPGGPVFSQAFTNVLGELEYLFSTQTGLNSSGSFIRNSFGVISTRFYNASQKQDRSFLHNMVDRWLAINITAALPYNSNVTGADLAVEHGIETQQLILHNDRGEGALIAELGIAEFILAGNDFIVNNGSILTQIPVDFQQGFTAGDSVTKFTELFTSSLGIFSNIQSDAGDWISILDTVNCNDGQCARATGAGGGVVSMQTNISTLDVNETTLSFIYSLVGLIGAGEINVVVNNNSGSGDVEVYVDANTDVTLNSTIISLPSSMDNASLVTLTFTCDVASTLKPLRECFVDNVKLNGTAISTTLINVSGFNSEICFSDGSRGADGLCSRGLFYNASADLVTTQGTWNITGTVSGGVSGSGSANNVPKWASTSSLTNSQITDNGTLINLGLDTNIDGNLTVSGIGNFTGNLYSNTLSVLTSLLQDTSPQLGGYLDANGEDIGSVDDEIEDVYVATNSIIYFGNGQEASMHYNGTNLIISG